MSSETKLQTFTKLHLEYTFASALEILKESISICTPQTLNEYNSYPEQNTNYPRAVISIHSLMIKELNPG